MELFARLRSACRNVFARTRVDRDLDDELAQAIDELAAEHAARGLDARAARRAALLDLGGTSALKERVRAEHTGWSVMEAADDVRVGWRLLRRDRAFTVAALLTLALGIGATTAIFSVVNGVLLRPLPFAAPDRLVQMFGTSNVSASDAVSNLPRYRDESTSFDALAGCEVTAAFLTDTDGAMRVMAVRTDGDFFGVLAVAPVRGRVYTPADGSDVVVIAEGFWRRQMAARPDVIGRTLSLNGRTLTIVGVMPAGFQFPYSASSILSGGDAYGRTDVWMPLDRPLGPRSRISTVIGRLRVDTSLQAAQSDVAGIARRLETEFPQTNAGRAVYLQPLRDAVVPPQVRRVLFMLFGAVGLLLLLACANVANLSLVRAALREREIATRVALGAGRARLVRQFLTESVCLSLAGGSLGLAVAWWGTRALLMTMAGDMPRAHEVALDWHVFLFLFAACATAGMLIGVAPAYAATRANVQTALLASSTRVTAGARQRRLRHTLVIAEIAIAFVLATGTALLVRELVRLRQTDLGMTTRNVMTMHLGQQRSEGTIDTLTAIERRVAMMPGVAATGLTQLLPLQNWGWTSNSSDFFAKGAAPPQPFFPIALRFVSPGYFDALGVRVERGRAFSADDVATTPGVIMINGTLARRYFGDQDPIGVATNRGTIVGVARDFRQINADQASVPELYTPIAQNWSQVSELGMTLLVRTLGRPEPLTGAIRSAVQDIDPQLAIFNVKTMDDVVEESLSTFTFFLGIIAAFAGLALVLALSGTYGVIASVVNSRMREFAIRVALGAQRSQMTRLVVRDAVWLSGAGLVVGFMLAMALAPLLDGLPVHVRPPDVSTIVPVALALLVVAIIACLVPAWRAAHVNPTEALRQD